MLKPTPDDERPRLGDTYELTRDTSIPDVWFSDAKTLAESVVFANQTTMGVYVKGVRFRVTVPAVRVSPFLRERIADGSLRLVTAWDRLGELDDENR